MHDNSIFVLLNLCAQGLTAVGAPYIGGALKTLAPVVVGGCTPEPRLRHLRHKISATRHEALQATIRGVEEHARLASKGCQPVLALLNLDFTLRKSLLEAVGLKHKLLLGSDMSLVEHAVEVYGILDVASHNGECPFGIRVIGRVVDSDIYATTRRATRQLNALNPPLMFAIACGEVAEVEFREVGVVGVVVDAKCLAVNKFEFDILIYLAHLF